MTVPDAQPARSADDEQLAALGYTGDPIEVARQLQQIRRSHPADVPVTRSPAEIAAPREEIR